MMDHEALRQAGFRLLNTLYDELLGQQASPAMAGELPAALKEPALPEAEAGFKEPLDTLAGVLQTYLEGRASEDALLYYLEQQFTISSSEVAGLLELLSDRRRTAADTSLQGAAAEARTVWPKISVIITTYNRETFLRQAVTSILEQDYPSLSVIVIDDCSTDGTERMMNDVFGMDERMIYMRNTVNQGPGHNRRRALAEHGDGEYILFLDDDDYLIDRSYLRKAAAFHEAHPGLSFVAANVFMEYTRSQQLRLSSLGLAPVTRKEEYFMNFEQKGYPKPASTLTALFRRDVLIRMGILKMNMVNDASIYLRALLAGDAGFIDTIAGVYRIHGNNITFNLSQSFLIENLEEKVLIRNMAIEHCGYSREQMNEWFNHNVFDTISYYLMNSAKNYGDFKFMYDWARAHAPQAFGRLRRRFRTKLMKKQLLRVSFVRALLSR